jgi:hypothetical protein
MQGQEYKLEVHGTYRAQDKDQRDGKSSNDDRHEFRVSDEIKLPPVSPSSAQLKSSKVESPHVSSGHYPHTAPNFDEEENGSRGTVPTGPFVAGKPTPTGTSAEKQPSSGIRLNPPQNWS